MKMLKAVAIAALVVSYHSTAEALGGPYSFKAGIGTVPWDYYFKDNNNAVARDWNGDGKTEVIVFPSAVGDICRGACPFPFSVPMSPVAFVSNPDGSYVATRAGGVTADLAVSEWTGNYFAQGVIALGNGGGTAVRPALIYNGLAASPGPSFNWHASAIGDVNKDGRLDIVGFSGGTVVYLGFNPGSRGQNVNGLVSDLGQIRMQNSAFAGTLMDIDGDGYPEIISGDFDSSSSGGVITPSNTANVALDGVSARYGAINVYKNNGGKSFSLMQIYPDTIPGMAGLRSMHNNGRDIIVYDECGDVCTGDNDWIRVFSTGGGRINLKQQFRITGTGAWSKGQAPMLVDLNGDGRNDLFINHYGNYAGNVGSQHGGIWLNNGNGTFSQLGTPIFANIPKSGMKGMLLPTHANSDGRMDWIIVYEDGSFGTLLSPAPAAVSTSSDEDEESVDNQLRRFKFAEVMQGGPTFWQLSFVQDQLSSMQSSFVDNSKVMSFNDINMVPVFNFDTNTALTFGATKADEYGEIDNAVVGLRYGEVDVAVGLDNNLLGWAPGQSLMHIDNPSTRYINISRKKSIGEWNFGANATYAFGTANGSYGYVKDVEDFHALGFGANVSYKNLKLKITQPLRIEQGGLQFSDFIADMEPNGRHIDYTLQYDMGINKHSNVEFSVSYMNDVDHILGNDDVRAVAKYKASW